MQMWKAFKKRRGKKKQQTVNRLDYNRKQIQEIIFLTVKTTTGREGISLAQATTKCLQALHGKWMKKDS